MDDCGSMGSGIELSFDDFEFEFFHVLWEVFVIADSGIGKPSSGFGSRVGVKEGGLEIFDEGREISKGGGI